MKEYSVKLRIEFDKVDGVRVSVIGAGDRDWLSFHISPKTLHMNTRVLTIWNPFMKRLKSELKQEYADNK